MPRVRCYVHAVAPIGEGVTAPERIALRLRRPTCFRALRSGRSRHRENPACDGVSSHPDWFHGAELPGVQGEERSGSCLIPRRFERAILSLSQGPPRGLYRVQAAALVAVRRACDALRLLPPVAASLRLARNRQERPLTAPN